MGHGQNGLILRCPWRKSKMNTRTVDRNSWHMKVARSIKRDSEYNPKNFCRHAWMVIGISALWLLLFNLLVLAVIGCSIVIWTIGSNPISLAFIAAGIVELAICWGVAIFIANHIDTVEKVLITIFKPIGRGIQFIFNPILRGLVGILIPTGRGLRFVFIRLIRKPFIASIDVWIRWDERRAKKPKKVKKEKTPGFFSMLWEAWHNRTCFLIEVVD